jgi:peptide subunit release factor 1 (eRF1)
MGRRKEFKVAKSFTITVKNIAWLEEQCHETGEKASVIIEKLITAERYKVRENDDRNKFYCPKCDCKQKITTKGFVKPKFYCSVCSLDLTVKINKHLQLDEYGSKTQGST